MISELQRRVLVGLFDKPLSTPQLVSVLSPTGEDQVKEALYQLTQQYLIATHPVIGGGCKDCACQVSFSWRLTRSGRQAIITGEAT